MRKQRLTDGLGKELIKAEIGSTLIAFAMVAFCGVFGLFAFWFVCGGPLAQIMISQEASKRPDLSYIYVAPPRPTVRPVPTIEVRRALPVHLNPAPTQMVVRVAPITP